MNATPETNTTNGKYPAPSKETVDAYASFVPDVATAAARRKFDAAVELLMSFEPSAEQLTEAAKQLVRIAHKGMRAE